MLALRLNIEELEAALLQCCPDCMSEEVQWRVRHASELLSVATCSKMALGVIVDIGALNCPPENALWQLKPYLRCLKDLNAEFPTSWFDIPIFMRIFLSSWSHSCSITRTGSRSSIILPSADTLHGETPGLIIESLTRCSRAGSPPTSASTYMPALPARRFWTPPTLIKTRFNKSYLAYRWWKSASDTPLRSPQDQNPQGYISNSSLPQFEIGDVFVHRFSDPFTISNQPDPTRIQQTWILLPEGWRDVSASFDLDDGTVSHPLYRDKVLTRHNAEGDPSFIISSSFKVKVSLSKRLGKELAARKNKHY